MKFEILLYKDIGQQIINITHEYYKTHVLLFLLQVSVNGQATELPVSVSPVYVHRSLHALHVDSRLYGFRVNWNLAQDVTSITLHGNDYNVYSLLCNSFLVSLFLVEVI